jgi:pyrimidine-nucleoside phosphorylase
MIEVLAEAGCVVCAAGPGLAPADRRLYALRDVTGTVESPNLICASIMSKKLAEGIDALVLDVKTGSGAFMKKEEDAVHLAELMCETGRRMGKKVVALITDMDQPLGRKAGNALEIEESIEVLRGGGAGDLRELCLELSAWMFYLGGRSNSVGEGKKTAAEMIATGRARDKFREIVRLQGGDAAVVDDPGRLPRARHTVDVPSPASGYVASTQCELLGVACVVLGGGREKKEDSIDPAVGLVFHKKVGDAVSHGEPLCTIYYNSEARLAEARGLVEESYRIEPSAPQRLRPLVHRVIGE